METDIILFNNIEFKQIKDFPNYCINKCGKILSIKDRNNNTRIIKCYNTGQGYRSIGI